MSNHTINNNKKNTAIFSFFSGIGFLDLGFEALKKEYDVVFVSDSIQEFISAHKFSREQMKLPLPEYGYGVESAEAYLSDDKRMSFLSKAADECRAADRMVGFIAGPPCPDFSVGGKNRGGEGDRGRLSSIYVDIVLKYEPDFFLFENVRGLWRTKKHREFFESLKERLKRGGYETTEQLINARWYGAPQDRDRILLIGFRGKGYKKHLSEFPWNVGRPYTSEQIQSIQWPKQDPFIASKEKVMPGGIIKQLTVQHWFDKNDVGNHANSKDYFRPKAGLAKFLTINEGDDKKKSYKRLHRWRYSPTCAYGNNEVHLHPYLPRRISVAEALSLQSLPKDFVVMPQATMSAKFKMIGNGVPFLVANGIAKAIAEYIEKERGGV